MIAFVAGGLACYMVARIQQRRLARADFAASRSASETRTYAFDDSGIVSATGKDFSIALDNSSPWHFLTLGRHRRYVSAGRASSRMYTDPSGFSSLELREKNST